MYIVLILMFYMLTKSRKQYSKNQISLRRDWREMRIQSLLWRVERVWEPTHWNPCITQSHIGLAVDSSNLSLDILYKLIYLYISTLYVYVMFGANNICVEPIEGEYIAIDISLHCYNGSDVHWVVLNPNTNHNSPRIYTFGEHRLKGPLFAPHLTLNWLKDSHRWQSKGFLEDNFSSVKYPNLLQ